MLLLLVDVVTRSVLGTFDHLGASFSSQLNAPGTAQVRLSLEAKGTAGLRWRDALAIDGLGVAKTFAYIVNETNGDVDWWGLAWQAPINVEERTVELQCAGIGSLFAARAKRTDTTWVNTDQATIVHDLLTEAQTGTRRDLYVVATIAATGVLRTRTILGSERHYYGTLVSEMAAWLDGYDYSYDALWSGGGDPPTHAFSMRYPAPRVTPLTTLIATGNVAITSWTVDGTTVATDVDSIGNQLVVTETQAPALTTYPAIDRSVSHSSSTETANLSQWALRALAAARQPQQAGTFRALLGPNDPITVRPGDAVRLVETDIVGIDATMVVTQMNVSQAGVGRIVDYTVVDPTTLARTADVL